jgi:cholesterol oxidase
MGSTNEILEFDYLIIGSGFGGSVSALRLSEKGYSVAVIESGKRYETKDFPKTNWNLRKFLWMPSIGCYGIQRLTLLNDVVILSGAGVGGGSLVYANTLYVPPQKVFDVPLLQKMGGFKSFLPFYETAKKMLGVTNNPRFDIVDDLMKKTAESFGVEKTFTTTPVGVNFDGEGIDPYFAGKGPIRNKCTFCGGCMVGCRHNAKNTLDKNYLYFAEKLGTKIFPETKAIEIRPLGEDGSEGYEVVTKATTGFWGSPKKKFKVKGLVLSAGVLGTVNLLLKQKEMGNLKKLSDKLGHVVRTNSESILGVTSKSFQSDFSNGVAITSSIYPDDHTHIEPVRYPKGSDAMNGMAAGVLVDGGGKVPRQLKFLWEVIKHPIDSVIAMIPFGFAKRSIILLVMQTVDNSIQLIRKRRWFFPFKPLLSSTQEHGNKIPTYIPIANEFAKRLAKNMGNGVARSSVNEVLLDVPMTAHVLGGSCIAETPNEGVIDLQNRVFGYKNFLVCDGSMVPVNLGVNPSLTITAFAERAMSFIPVKGS